MPFDFEARASMDLADRSKLTVGIVGFGTFGQFLARRLVTAGHTVIATSRSPYEEVAASMGVSYFRDSDDFCEQHPDVVILATSILSMDQVLARLPVQRLRRNTLIVDVLSVKEFPKRLLLSKLPRQVDILCTHPMFGPDSGKASWEGLNFMYERVRIGDSEDRQERCEIFLDFFRKQGCKMVEITCEEHDKAAASTQFITHTVGRMLGAMGLESTPIDTKGYQSLLSLVENTTNDSFELYYGLFMYNQNATQELDRLERAFDDVKKQLFTKLHDKVRAQLFLEEEGRSREAAMHNGNGSEAIVAQGKRKKVGG
jgi:arogenate dehydrogenase (NADP+), plant